MSTTADDLITLGQATRIVRAIISSDMEAYVFMLGFEGDPIKTGVARQRFDDFTQSVRPVEGFMIAKPSN